MSELIASAARRVELLKHMIRQLHEGRAPEQVRAQLARLLKQIPYNDVVRAEQELIRDGLPVEEVQRLCDLHTAALRGAIDVSAAPKPPPGHPAHTFSAENQALRWEVRLLADLYAQLDDLADDGDPAGLLTAIRTRFNALMDVEKHYLRKEYLLFPFLEKHGITGPPKVMWGKHDETRALLKGAMEALQAAEGATAGEVKALVALALRPASNAVAEMVEKEEQILLPMALDTLTDAEWYAIAQQSLEYGYCLYDPVETWRPEGGVEESAAPPAEAKRIQLPSGSFTVEELTAVLNTIPFDMTFVDASDTVRYFTQGTERIFARSRAILGRKVQFCHPPSSVKVVDQILADFRSGRHDKAAFWIQLKGRFICIEYFALRGPGGEYLGCLEVSQDLTEKRALQGEQRLLNYTDRNQDDGR